MTIECLKKFGIRVTASPDMSDFKVSSQDYHATDYTVEGDWSQASYLLALGALSGEVVVTNLNAESLQGDRIVLNLLQKMGARLSVRRSSVMVQKSYLHGITADLTDCIDLLPTLAVLAAVADGESQFSGIKSARLKESNRVESLSHRAAKNGHPGARGRKRPHHFGRPPARCSDRQPRRPPTGNGFWRSGDGGWRYRYDSRRGERGKDLSRILAGAGLLGAKVESNVKQPG